MNTLSGGMQDLTGLGYAFKGASAGNGLLTGLTEAWNPDATKAMIGQKTGLNTGTASTLVYVVQAGFPGGHALQLPSVTPVGLTTPSSALLQAIGNTDFLMIEWMLAADPSNGPALYLGEGSTNGLNRNTGGAGLVSSNIPGADNSYNCFIDTTPDTPFTASAPHMVATWYTNSDSTLWISCDAGTVYSIVNTSGVGPADPSNALNVDWGGSAVVVERGPVYLWQGTAGVANAVSQLGSLYSGKLQYSDFT